MTSAPSAAGGAVPIPPPLPWISQRTRNVITCVGSIALCALGRWSGPSFVWTASLVLGGTIFYNEVGQRIHKQIRKIPFEYVFLTVVILTPVDVASVKYLATMLAAADLGYRIVARCFGELEVRPGEKIWGFWAI